MAGIEVPAQCRRPIVPIAYGTPGPELIEASGRGEVASAGFVLRSDRPAFECLTCGATAGELGDDLVWGAGGGGGVAARWRSPQCGSPGPWVRVGEDGSVSGDGAPVDEVIEELRHWRSAR